MPASVASADRPRHRPRGSHAPTRLSSRRSASPPDLTDRLVAGFSSSFGPRDAGVPRVPKSFLRARGVLRTSTRCSPLACPTGLPLGVETGSVRSSPAVPQGCSARGAARLQLVDGVPDLDAVQPVRRGDARVVLRLVIPPGSRYDERKRAFALRPPPHHPPSRCAAPWSPSSGAPSPQGARVGDRQQQRPRLLAETVMAFARGDGGRFRRGAEGSLISRASDVASDAPIVRRTVLVTSRSSRPSRAAEWAQLYTATQRSAGSAAPSGDARRARPRRAQPRALHPRAENAPASTARTSALALGHRRAPRRPWMAMDFVAFI